MSSSNRWGTRARFIIGAATSYTLVIGITAGLHEIANLAPHYAYAAALVVALIFNFLFNRHLVFRASKGDGKTQAARFVATSCAFRLGEWITFSVLIASLGTHYAVLATLVQAVSLLFKYVAFRRFVFR